jgi:hypothetical protein
LLQDLADISEGIEVFHAGDKKKQFAQDKRDRKIKRQEAKQRKLEKNNTVNVKPVQIGLWE